MAGVAAGSAAHLPGTLAGLVGYSTGQMLLVYIVLYFTALRRRGAAWKVGAFVLLLLIAVVLNFGRVGLEVERFRNDLSGLRGDLSAVIDGRDVKPGGAPADSMAGITRNLLVQLQADQKQADAEAEAAGAAALLSPAALKQRPDVLKDCGRLDTLASHVPAQLERWRGRMAAARDAISKMNAPEALRTEVLSGFDASSTWERPDVERRFELSGLAYKELAGLCRVLARRHWQGTEQFMFTSDRDLAEYDAIVTRYNGYFGEQQALMMKSQGHARESLGKLDRELK